ncbi:MAG: CdaR family protein [Polyangia bacterium]
MRAAVWRALTHDIPLKLAALVIAIALFVVVRSDKDSATGVFVRVIYTLPTDRVLVSDPVSEVKLAIRGPWTKIQKLDERELEPIRIDLSRTKESVLHFSESMVSLPAGLRVVSMVPTQTKLDFEPRAERDVPVQPLLEGQPRDGFRVASITVEPDHVRIAGPKRVIAHIERVTTRPFRIEDATGAVRDSISLEAPPRTVQYLNAGSVTVTADVRPAIVERSLDGVKIGVAGLTHLDADVDPKVAQVILRGPFDLVRRVSPTSIQLVLDARLEDGRPPALYKKRIDVTGLPSGVAAEVRPDTALLSTRHHRE